MLGSAMNGHNEQIAQLQAELAELRQENTELRTSLEVFQLKQRSQSAEDLQSLEVATDPEQLAYEGLSSRRQHRISISAFEHCFLEDHTQLARLQVELERAAELEKVNGELRRRSREVQQSYSILKATAQATDALLTINDFDQAVNMALQILGESLETDRTKVLESLFDDPTRPFSRYHNILYEWTSPGTIGQLSHTPQVDTRGRMEGFFEMLLQTNGFGGLLAEWDESLHEAFQALEVKSLYVVPIYVDNHWWGILAFDDCKQEKHRTQVEMSALQTAANCIGSAIARQRIEQAREEAERQVLLEREKAALERAAELVKANFTLRRSLSWLADQGNLNQFLARVLLEIASIAKADLAQLFVLKEPERMLDLTARVIDGALSDRPTPTEPAIFSTPFSADITPAFRYMEEQNLFLTLDMAMLQPELTEMMWPDAIDWHLREGRKQVASLVLKAGDRSVGFLGLGFRELREFSQEERELVFALANQASLAILLIQLAEKANQSALAKLNEVIARGQEQSALERAAELAKLNEALQTEVIERHRAEGLARGQAEALVKMLTAFAAAPALDNFLGIVLQSIVEQIGGYSGGIWLYDESQNTTVLHLSYEDGQIQQGNQIASPGCDRNFLQQWGIDYIQVLRQQKFLIQDIQQFALLPAYAAYYAHNQQRGIKMILVVALFFGETFLGSITLRCTNYRDYKPEELELLKALAHQAALVIQLTRLAEQAKQSAISEERNRMAREIHDTLAQSFISIRMQLEAATRLLSRKPEQAQACITFAQDLAKSGLAEARRSVWALQPEAEDYRHLSTTLEHFAAQQTTETSIPIEVAIVGTLYALPPDIGMNLLRIGQEALNNAIRHASAQTIHLTLIYAPNQIQLQIQDDGQGFDPQLELGSGGFGLMGMQQRSDRLGGTFTINGQSGHGTEVKVIVPILEGIKTETTPIN